MRAQELLLVKVQRTGIDAKALAGCFAWTIVKNMPQMRTTLAAYYFGALHAMRAIDYQLGGSWKCLVKAWPARV